MRITHYGLVTPYGNMVWVNIDSVNDLLPDSTMPLPDSTLT